ncbi:MAG: nuclear transport factor 2 family protein [Novosphingobium sp.]|nr:nuclear transport factor 2 family protein [Novosphingobium sp.]
MGSGGNELEERIRRLEDLEEIRGLRMEYHHCVNDGRFAEAAPIFTEDAYVEYGGVGSAKGKGEIVELFSQLSKAVTLIKQFVSNHMVTIDGDEASGIAYLDARYAQDGKSLIAAVRFDDRYLRTPDGWRITDMRASIQFSVPVQEGWAGDTQGHLKPLPLT